MVNSIYVKGREENERFRNEWRLISERKRNGNTRYWCIEWKEDKTCEYIYTLNEKGKPPLRRWERMAGMKEKKNSSVEMRVTVEIRRIQVGQVWRTEVPYGPRKPAPAWRPPGPHATSLSVLPSATTIYHLRGSVILSRLRLSITDTSSRGHTYRDWERDMHASVCI